MLSDILFFIVVLVGIYGFVLWPAIKPVKEFQVPDSDFHRERADDTQCPDHELNEERSHAVHTLCSLLSYVAWSIRLITVVWIAKVLFGLTNEGPMYSGFFIFHGDSDCTNRGQIHICFFYSRCGHRGPCIGCVGYLSMIQRIPDLMTIQRN